MNKLRIIFNSQTAKDSSILFLGSIISNIFGLIVLTLVTKKSTTYDLGLFLTGLTVAQLIADVFELGVNPAITNFVSGASKSEQLVIAKVSLILKLLIGGLVSFFIIIFAPQINWFFFHNSSFIPYLQFSAVGAFCLMLIAWGQNLLQSQRNFLWAGIINTSTNIFRLAIFLILMIIGISSSLVTFLQFQLVLIISVLLIFIFLGFSFLKSRFEGKLISQILRFGLPLGGSFTLAAIYSRLDQLIMFQVAGAREAGIYGLASRLSIIIVFGLAAFNGAITPRFVSLAEKDFGNYFKKTLYVIGVAAAFLFLGIILAPILIPIIFKPELKGAVLPFQILSIGILFFAISMPFTNAIIYRHKITKFSLCLSLFSLVITFMMLEYLIPIYKSVGAAIAVSLLYTIQSIITIGYYFWINKK